MTMECPFTDPGLNRGEVEACASLHCSTDEVAAYFGTSEDVIREFYMADVQRGWLKGKIAARQMLTNRAKGDPTNGIDPDPRAIDFMAKNFIGGESGKR